MKLLYKASLILLVLLGIVSCFKSIYEPDVWWQIATGNWILENGTVPTIDVFSYTYEGEPWINVKWGSEVIMAFISNKFGVEFLGVLQAIILLLIGIVSYKTAHFFKENKNSDNFWKLAFGYAAVLFLFIIHYRLNGRPELFSHLFTAILLYILMRYIRTDSWFVLWLVPLQIVWTNMHEAYGVGIVVSLLVTLTLWFEHLYFYKKHEVGIAKPPIKLSLAMILSIVGIGLNPNGFKMILHPFNILGQLNENKYTEELISFEMPGYWQYQSIGMVLIFVVLVYFIFKQKGSLFLRPIRTYGLAPTLLIGAFLYLSLTSFRNIPFFLIVTFPILIHPFSLFLSKIGKPKQLLILLLFIQAFFYITLINGKFYETFLPQERYGLQIRAEMNPIGVSNFVKEEGIDGKGFVDYLSSSYFIANNPGFKSYIDLRDLDIFPTNFFDNVFFIYQNPNMPIQGGGTPWQFADSVDRFNYVVTLNNPQFQQFNRYLFHDNDDFILVYADNLNSLYLRNTEKNKSLIEKYGYKRNKPIFRPTTPSTPPKMATVLSSLFYWGYKPEKSKDFPVQEQGNSYYNYLGIQLGN